MRWQLKLRSLCMYARVRDCPTAHGRFGVDTEYSKHPACGPSRANEVLICERPQSSERRLQGSPLASVSRAWSSIHWLDIHRIGVRTARTRTNGDPCSLHSQIIASQGSERCVELRAHCTESTLTSLRGRHSSVSRAWSCVFVPSSRSRSLPVFRSLNWRGHNLSGPSPNVGIGLAK
jgi:hypothetical protein